MTIAKIKRVKKTWAIKGCSRHHLGIESGIQCDLLKTWDQRGETRITKQMSVFVKTLGNYTAEFSSDFKHRPPPCRIILLQCKFVNVTWGGDSSEDRSNACEQYKCVCTPSSWRFITFIYHSQSLHVMVEELSVEEQGPKILDRRRK